MNEKIDLLERNQFVNDIIKIIKQLSSVRKGCCFSIEGSWGIGKTYVLNTIMKKLESQPDDPYFLFYYNCWQHDYYEEPSIAIISAMIRSVKKDEAMLNARLEDTVKAGYEVVGDKFKEIAGLYLENKIGVNLISWADEIKQKKDANAELKFDKMFNFSQTIDEVRKKLQEIARERTIVLIVDELDRCIPAYAIKVLERLHHIFYGLENTIVLMAVDRNQLEHSVEEMFGVAHDETSMNVERYLKKFIDFSITLDYGRIRNLFHLKYKDYFDRFSVWQQQSDQEELYELLSDLLSDIDIRRQEKLFAKAFIVHSMICVTQTNLSVLAFEIMYGALKLWDFTDMNKIAEINDAVYRNLDEKYGTRKIDILKKIVSKGELHKYDRKYLSTNLFGKVTGYFSVLFNQADKETLFMARTTEEYHHELEIVSEYYKYSEIIK